MSTIVSPTGTVTQSASSFLNPPQAEIRTTGGKSLGVDDFLKLITVQLSNQDPLKPMEDTQFISQMANFTSLEQMQVLSKDFAAFSAQQTKLTAQDYLGKYVSLADGKDTVNGQVTKVSFEDDGVLLTVNGKTYDVTALLSVSNSAPPAPSAPVTNSSTETSSSNTPTSN